MPSAKSPVDPSAVAHAPSKGRPRFTFTVPEACRINPDDPATLTMVPITLGEEQMALKAHNAGGLPLMYELAKMSLVAVDGRPLDWAGGARDTFLEKVSPPIRQLIQSAWAKVNVPAKEADEAFLASMRTEI